MEFVNIQKLFCLCWFGGKRGKNIYLFGTSAAINKKIAVSDEVEKMIS